MFGSGLFCVCVFAFFIFIFCCMRLRGQSYCSRTVHTIHALFTYCSWDPPPLYSEKNIKNGSHGIIHQFKNYFVTMFSVFSKISYIEMDSVSIEPKHGSIFWTTNYSINGISKKKKEKKITIISMVLVFFFFFFWCLIFFFFFWCGCLIWYDRKLWAMENLWTESIGYGWKIFFLLLLYIVVLFQNRNRTEISHLSLYFMKSKKWAAFTLLRSIFIRKLNEMSISFLSYYSQTGK